MYRGKKKKKTGMGKPGGFVRAPMRLGNKLVLFALVISFLTFVILILASPPMDDLRSTSQSTEGTDLPVTVGVPETADAQSVSGEETDQGSGDIASNDTNVFRPYHDPMKLPLGWQLCYWILVGVHLLAYSVCSFRWTYCSLRQEKLRPIRFNELILLWTRWLHFLYSGLLLCLIFFSDYSVPAAILFPLSVFLWISFFHALSRTTFRPLPCYLLALSAVVLFICASGLPYQSENMWGIEGFVSKVYRFLSKIFDTDSTTFKTLFTSSAVIAVLVSTVLSAGRKILKQYQSQAEDTSSKNTRRQLLSHWWYNPKAVLIENANVCVAVGFVLACGFILLAASNKATKDEAGGYSLLFFAAVASISAAIGIFGLFTVRDNDLLKSEYYFLHYTALQIGQLRLGKDGDYTSSVEEALKKGNPRRPLGLRSRGKIWYDKFKIRANHWRFTAHITRGLFGCVSQEKAERRIRDFCQVAVHLLIYNSTIRSENVAAHKISFLFESIGEVVRCKQTHGALLSELFNAYRDARQTTGSAKDAEQEAAAKENGGEDDADSQTSKQKTKQESKKAANGFSESDLLLSSMLFSLINSPHARKCPPIININVCIQTMREVLQSSNVNFFLFTRNLSANDLIDLVQFDALNRLARMYYGDGCIASWQCDKACESCRYAQARTLADLEIAHNKRLTVLLYPLFVLQSLAERCPDIIPSGKNISYRLDTVSVIVEEYYRKIASLSADSCPAKEPVPRVIPRADDPEDIFSEKIQALANNAFPLFQKFMEIFQNIPVQFQGLAVQGIRRAESNLILSPIFNGKGNAIMDLMLQISSQMTGQLNVLHDKETILRKYWEGQTQSDVAEALHKIKEQTKNVRDAQTIADATSAAIEADRALEKAVGALHYSEEATLNDLKSSFCSLVLMVSGYMQLPIN
jgi:hypothetical protein